MQKSSPNSCVVAVAAIVNLAIALTASAQTVQLSRAELLDKIRGAWVGKAYGVALGGPTEFKHMGTIIEGPIEMDEKGLERIPRQDDLFVNMAFLQMVAEHGFDTPAEVFAEAFAYAGFGLGHANSQARQNILAGVPANMSGHPQYSPHAEDIDFQIEADFIGLIHPGLPQTAFEMSDRVGHIMNYGDGFYGGVFVAAMYAAAFVQEDPHEIVASGLKALPQDSGYAEVIRDVIRLHKEHPKDWRATWHELQAKWGHEDRCPWGVTGAHGSLKGMFNISARLNGAYIVLGMLYGDGDYDKTVEISTRAGQDSDCNPSTAAGVLGAMMGYDALPQHVKDALAPYMDVQFSHTIYTIETASKACLELGIENVKAHGGKEVDGAVFIEVQPFEAPPGPAEVALANLTPTDGFWVSDNRIAWQGEWKDNWDKDGLKISGKAGDYMEVRFPGTAVYVESWVRENGGILEVTLDGKPMGTRDMYLKSKNGKTPGWTGQNTAVWLTGLADGEHTLRVTVTGEKNPNSKGTEIGLGRIASYRGWIGAAPPDGYAAAGGSAKSPLVGSWTLTVTMGGKNFDVNVVVNPDLTGTAGWQWSAEIADLESVVSEGKDASFGCPGIIGLEFQGSIDGDTFEGDVASDYGDGTFTGVRD
jgi:hypothetical protein